MRNDWESHLEQWILAGACLAGQMNLMYLFGFCAISSLQAVREAGPRIRRKH